MSSRDRDILNMCLCCVGDLWVMIESLNKTEVYTLTFRAVVWVGTREIVKFCTISFAHCVFRRTINASSYSLVR